MKESTYIKRRSSINFIHLKDWLYRTFGTVYCKDSTSISYIKEMRNKIILMEVPKDSDYINTWTMSWQEIINDKKQIKHITNKTDI